VKAERVRFSGDKHWKCSKDKIEEQEAVKRTCNLEQFFKKSRDSSDGDGGDGYTNDNYVFSTNKIARFLPCTPI
jgi:hypothetical protein